MDSPAAWKRRGRWLPAAAWALAIFVFSSVPGAAIPGPVADWSLLGHVAEFAVLGGLVVFGLGRRDLTVRLSLAILLACSLYGVSDEGHQAFVPGRTPDVLDWTADTVGAAAGIAIAAAIRKRGAFDGSAARGRE